MTELLKLASGELITKPGVYDIPIDYYHGQPCDGPSISSSGLRSIWSDSPAHYWATSALNPNRMPQADNPAFNLGRLAHKVLLEGPAGLERDFAVRPDIWADWRTKDAQNWRREMTALGKTVITQADVDAVAAMVRSLSAHPLVRAGILDGDVERSLIFKDHRSGVWLKSRPDVIPGSSGDLVDLKTTSSVATEDLQRSIADFGYHMQAALAGAAMKAAMGVDMTSFTFVWVEKAPPHCVRVTTLTPEDLLRGEMQIDAAVATFAECLRKGRWPGPGGDQQDAEFLSIPSFRAKSIDERLEAFKVTGPVVGAELQPAE